MARTNQPPNPAIATSNAKSLNIGTLLESEENWAVWELSLYPMMEDEGLMTFIIDPVTQHAVYSIVEGPRARRAITCNLSDSVKKILIDCKSAQDMWDVLVKKFSGVNRGRKLRAIKKLGMFRIEGSDMEANVNRLQGITRTLLISNGSSTISVEDFAVAMLLNALPKSYSAVRVNVESNQNTTISSLKDQIINEEEAQNDSNDVPFAGFSGNKKSPGNCEHGRKGATCWTCHPEKHPRHSTCTDCNQKGHNSKNSRYSSLQSITRDDKPPTGKGMAVFPTPRFSTDDEPWQSYNGQACVAFMRMMWGCPI